MAQDTETLQLGSSYPLFVPVLGADVVLTVTGGGTIYYGPDTAVSSSHNTGSVALNASVTLTTGAWIVSASTSVVSVTNYSGGGDLENLYASWTVLNSERNVPLADSTSAGAYLLTGSLRTFVAVAGAETGQGMFYLDPGLYLGDSRVPKLRLRASVTANAVAPACTNLVYALYPVATIGGTSGNNPTVATLGSVVCSTTILTPSATTKTTAYGTSVVFPAAGFYVFQLTVGSGGTAANAKTLHSFELQMQRTAP